MKNISYIIIFTSIVWNCNAQTPENSSILGQTDTTKSKNLLDVQTEVFGQAFTLGGISDEDNPTGGATNYLEMIDNIEASEELKDQMRQIYNLYDTSLDSTKKAELKLRVSKMLEEAIAKGQIEK